MNKIESTRLRGFLNLFNFAVDTTKSGANRFIPTKQVRDSKGEMRTIKDVLSPSARNIFDVWQSSTYFERLEAEDRRKLWEDMDRAFFNSAIIGKAVKLTRDETIQADMNTIPIGVEAPRKQRKFILDLFDRIGIYSKLPSIAEDIILYGNAGLRLGFDSRGVSEVIQTDVYDILNRIEFNAHEIEKQIRSKASLLNRMQTYQRMDALLNSIRTNESYNADDKYYLFGFQIGQEVLPPWKFIHFRNFTAKSPFRPFGLPMYINSIAPYRQYDAGLSLQVAARGARFPIDRYALNFPETLNATTKLEKVLEFINMIENSGIRGIPKEGIGIGERIVTIKDLFEFDQITPQIDIGKIDDLDLLKEDLIESTDIPANFFIAGKEGWGNSGISLVQQYKPFARTVYKVQSILLEGLSQLAKIAMIQSNQFSANEIDFVLTMPYPESQTSPEIISSQNDLMNLASGVMDMLADKVFGGTASELPIEVKRQILHQILPYDQARIDSWINGIEKDRQKMDKEMDKQAQSIMTQDKPDEVDFNDYGYSNKDHEYKVRHIESYKKMVEKTGGMRKFSEMIQNEIFAAKQEHFREWNIGGKHGFSSKIRKDSNDDFPAERLIELDKERVKGLKKLHESNTKEMQKFNKDYNESIKLTKYKFSSDYYKAKAERKRKFKEEQAERILVLTEMANRKIEEIESES